MGFLLLVLFVILEVLLVVWTEKREKEKRNWRKNRLFIRLGQTVLTLLVILLPSGQKWRFVPVLILLFVLLVCAGLIMWIKRKREDGTKKTGSSSAKLSSAWTFTDTEEKGIKDILALIDVEKTGVMGHSMGGATSVEIGRERDDIDAVVCIDGTMLGEETGYENGQYLLKDEPYQIPLLDFSNESEHKSRETYRKEGTAYANNYVQDNAPKGIYTGVWFKGAEHMDFTDLPLLSPFLGNMLGSGDRDKEETMTVVNSLILKFYDYYLKGEGEFTAKSDEDQIHTAGTQWQIFGKAVDG